ncbi:MAG: cupredoxin domain-containing protein [archaeon]
MDGKMKNVIIGVAVILAVLSVALFGLNSFASSNINGAFSATEQSGETVKEIKVDAFRFGYNPSTIEVNSGNRVRILINNTDTTHGMRIPDLNLRSTNGDTVLEFVAEKTGEFKWYCAVMCGEGHSAMGGTLIVK